MAVYLVRVTGIGLVLGLLAGCALGFVSGRAKAHSWYPLPCCSDRDCAPYPAGMVKESADGWRLASGEFIARGTEKRSEDEHFHLCRGEATGLILCFFVPSRGV